MVESILLSVTRIETFRNNQRLSTASGFFFEREDGRLFLVSSRHVFADNASGHRPDRIDIELHTDEANLAEASQFCIPLYEGSRRLWRQGKDNAGAVDVAVIELDRQLMPESAVFCAFTSAHLPHSTEDVEIGRALLVVGFPLGFHDTLHHMPVARQAVVASSFGLRFGGGGYFLTDARTHRGISGSPVVMRLDDPGDDTSRQQLPWALLGIHSARLDVSHRDLAQDEGLGLNCVWYADILMVLTEV